MNLHFKEYGDRSATLMVFLHGGGVSGWMWEKQIKYFTHYHCIVPDLPEHGLSRESGDFSIKESAEKIIKLIEKLAQGKEVIVIGFSLGAQIIVQMLSIKQDLIDYAIINSALVRPMTLAKVWIKPSIKITFPLVHMRWFSKIQAKSLYIEEDHFDTYYKESRQMNSHSLTRILEENMSFKIPENFSKAKGKILVTVGEKEKKIMKKSAYDIVNSNPNCTGFMFLNVGHGMSLANPELFNTIIDKWMIDGDVPPTAKLIESSR